jgi:hypothetical protein
VTEETKPAIIGKPPMSWDNRIKTMSTTNLAGECNRISKNPESLLSGALADVLLIAVFHDIQNNRGNDPYMLDHSSTKTKFFEIR